MKHTDESSVSGEIIPIFLEPGFSGEQAEGVRLDVVAPEQMTVSCTANGREGTDIIQCGPFVSMGSLALRQVLQQGCGQK